MHKIVQRFVFFFFRGTGVSLKILGTAWIFRDFFFHLRLGTEPQRFIANDSTHWGENHFLL